MSMNVARAKAASHNTGGGDLLIVVGGIAADGTTMLNSAELFDGNQWKEIDSIPVATTGYAGKVV